jgi:hydroxymethylpyrimidine/phosphomethylpyrimidine kinase
MSDGRPSGSFTASAWRDIAGWRDAVAGMPFIRALADGSLAADAFGFYLAQDAAYLVEFARALSVASHLAPTREGQTFFAGSAHQALEVESVLHRDWLSRHGAAQNVPASPVTAAYTDHLLAVGSRDGYPVLVAALLPCYWLYAHIGTVVLAEAGDLDAHPYGQWIKTYADPAFQDAARTACDLADAASDSADATTRARMLAMFVRSSMHEYLFFDQGMSQPDWPTPPTAG